MHSSRFSGTENKPVAVMFRAALITCLIPLLLTGCEAALNLSGVEQEQSKPLNRTDQLQALVANDRVQVAVGNSGLVLTRRLGEQDWQRQVLPGEPGLIDLDACADNTLIALSFEKQLWRSGDDGFSWQSFELNTPENILDLTCAPNGTYWAVGSFSTLLSSTDQGQSWNEVSLNEDAMLTSIQFVSTSLGYTSGEFGTLARTTDGGDNWEVLAPMREEFYPQTTLFTDAEIGWSVGLDGTVLHTTDGGHSWTLSSTPVAAPLYGLFEAQGDLYALGENATVLKRNGEEWTPVPVKARPVYLRAGLATEQGALVAGGSGTLLSLTL